MTIRLLIIDETPSKLILKTNPAYNQDRDETYASSRKSGFGCLGFFLLAFALIFVNYSTSQTTPWYFWVVTGIIFAAFLFFIFLQINFVNTNKNFARDIKVTIDMDTQQGRRVEKLSSGTERVSEVNLNDVVRILIECQAVGHSCKLLLELKNEQLFEVNSAVDFELGDIKEMGRKLGGLLNKPVILKWLEGSKVDSEEEI